MIDVTFKLPEAGAMMKKLGLDQRGEVQKAIAKEFNANHWCLLIQEYLSKVDILKMMESLLCGISLMPSFNIMEC